MDLTRIAAVLCDVDGTLTPSQLVYDANGAISKAFHVRDGERLVRARRAGLHVGLVTGRDDACVSARAADLKLAPVIAGVSDKVAAVAAWKGTVGLDWVQIAMVGDDLPDLALMRQVGLGVAVADAAPALRRIADVVTRAPGGGGAVAEIIERILAAQALL